MHKFKRSIAAALISFVLIGVGAFALQTPASANADNAQCFSGYLCIYEHVGYNGSEYDIPSGYRGSCVTFGWGFWHDRASSIQNAIGTDVTFYNDAYCGGGSLWMYNGMNIGDLGAWGANDSLDSVWISY